uniref:AA9 family lytic polysaccharide monooxygenase n=1 Tax=Rhizophlyctis rosea TaxID=64517 RepID=A0A2U8U9W7_9FUNG|nr:lytic polysaccharide monooxygenase 9 [Rhizophlyctis rosea]
MKAILSALLLASGASAHAIFRQIAVNGAWQGDQAGIRMPSTSKYPFTCHTLFKNNPVTDVSSGAVTCNTGTSSTSRKISVRAGDQVSMKMCHNDGNCGGSDPIIASSHHGPVMAYMAKVSDSSSGTPTNGWFKIYEDGITAVDKLISNNGVVSFTIPSCIPAGDYLLRTEAIALHSAYSYPGAQLYMTCTQLTVSGGGSYSPATVSFPGAYHGSDPGITVSIYGSTGAFNPNMNYQIPGPRPMSCSGQSSGGGGSSNPTTTQQQQQPTTTANSGGGGGGSCAAKIRTTVSDEATTDTGKSKPMPAPVFRPRTVTKPKPSFLASNFSHSKFLAAFVGSSTGVDPKYPNASATSTNAKTSGGIQWYAANEPSTGSDLLLPTSEEIEFTMAPDSRDGDSEEEEDESTRNHKAEETQHWDHEGDKSHIQIAKRTAGLRAMFPEMDEQETLGTVDSMVKKVWGFKWCIWGFLALVCADI